MSEINTGGPAFPCPMSEQTHSNQDSAPFQGGMSLRDYFAAKAMQGMLSDSAARNEDTGKKLSIPDDCAPIALVSYKMADAMMKARESTT